MRPHSSIYTTEREAYKNHCLTVFIFSNLVKFGQQIKPHNKLFLIHIWIYMTSYLCVVFYTELLQPQEQDLFGKDLSFRPSLLDKLIKTTQI